MKTESNHQMEQKSQHIYTNKGWVQGPLPFKHNAYDKERREKVHHEISKRMEEKTKPYTKKKIPVDPATVEAELQLEEKLWAS